MVFPFPCLHLEWKQQGNTFFGSNKGTHTLEATKEHILWKQQGNTYFGSNKGTHTLEATKEHLLTIQLPSDKEFVLVSTSHLNIITHHKTCFVQQVGDQNNKKSSSAHMIHIHVQNRREN